MESGVESSDERAPVEDVDLRNVRNPERLMLQQRFSGSNKQWLGDANVK